jgi:hypothetical protein
MSSARRAYDILRSYIGREWERIQGIEWFQAEQELRSPPSKDPAQTEGTTETAAADPTPHGEDAKARARRILGVAETCTFEEVRKSYVRLKKRCDATNFPTGSEEARRAEDIRVRIEWAYQVLSEGVDIAEQRFRSLELE